MAQILAAAAVELPADLSAAPLCRGSCEVLEAHRGQFAAAIAAQRRDSSALESTACRQKAAEWRRQREMRASRALEAERAEKAAEAEARRREAEAHVQRTAQRALRTGRVLSRLKEELAKQMGGPDGAQAEERPASAAEGRASHVDRLRRLRVAEERREQDLRKAELWRTSADLLERAPRAMLEDAFGWCRLGEAGAEVGQLVEALGVLGLTGLDHAERMAVQLACEKARDRAIRRAPSLGGELVSFDEFAGELAPKVRRQLEKLRGSHLCDVLTEMGIRKEGRLARDEVLHVVQELWQFDAGADVDGAAHQELMRRVGVHAANFADGSLALPLFTQRICDVAEELQLNTHSVRVNIAERHSLAPSILGSFSQDLAILDKLFACMCDSQTRRLDAAGCLLLLRRLGLAPPKRHPQRDECKEMLSASGEDVDFEEFLRLVGGARDMLERRLRQELQQAHAKWLEAGGPQSSEALMKVLLQAAGICPQSTAEQRAVGRAVRLLGGGTPTFDDALRTCCRAQEMIHRAKMQREGDFARQAGIGEQELNQMRCVFDRLDADESGSLCYMEVYEALKLMQVHVSSLDEVKAALDLVDADGSGCVELTEFMGLVKLVREQCGSSGLPEPELFRPERAEESEGV